MKYLAAFVSASIILFGTSAGAADLRIALNEDPDILDPAQGGSFVGREVFAALCDKLIDVAPDMKFVPQLATEWTWSADGKALTMKLRDGVLFHDGTKLDADAVKINLDRYRTDPESRRKGEVKPIANVVVVDPLTVRLELAEPYAPLLAVLADRAGMIMSPKALTELGDKIGTKPVCAGPYRFVERVAQERIVVERFDKYWNPGPYTRPAADRAQLAVPRRGRSYPPGSLSHSRSSKVRARCKPRNPAPPVIKALGIKHLFQCWIPGTLSGAGRRAARATGRNWRRRSADEVRRATAPDRARGTHRAPRRKSPRRMRAQAAGTSPAAGVPFPPRNSPGDREP